MDIVLYGITGICIITSLWFLRGYVIEANRSKELQKENAKFKSQNQKLIERLEKAHTAINGCDEFEQRMIDKDQEVLAMFIKVLCDMSKLHSNEKLNYRITEWYNTLDRMYIVNGAAPLDPKAFYFLPTMKQLTTEYSESYLKHDKNDVIIDISAYANIKENK